MYWCKSTSLLAVSVLLIAACKPDVKESGGAKYFDLKKYFTAEAVRMGKIHPAVLKTVIYNNQPEQKRVEIKNWQRELELFTESDINKPAWRDSYTIVKTHDSVIYTAIDTTLKTRSLVIVSDGDKIKAIRILNFTKNLLYQTGDQLSYYPDSVYQITKHQAVRIMGAHNYQITGKLR
jgi:hypothetical protein